MAGNDPRKQLLTLIRDFATEKSQGERRISNQKKRIEELRSDLDAANAELEGAKREKEIPEQELNGYEVELSMNEASIRTLENYNIMVESKTTGDPAFTKEIRPTGERCWMKVHSQPLPKHCRMKVKYPQQGYHSVQTVLTSLREKHDKFMLEYYQNDFGAAPLPSNLKSHGLLSVYATQLLEKETKIFQQRTEGKRHFSPPPTPPPSPPPPPPPADGPGPPPDIMGQQEDEDIQEEEENGEGEDNGEEEENGEGEENGEEEENGEGEENGEEGDLICNKLITKLDAERLEIPEELHNHIIFPPGRRRVTIILIPQDEDIIARGLRLWTRSDGTIVARKDSWEDMMYFFHIQEGSEISFHTNWLENCFGLGIGDPPPSESDDDGSSTSASTSASSSDLEPSSDSNTTPSQASASSDAQE